MKIQNKEINLDLLRGQYWETFILLFDIAIGSGNDMVYFHFDNFVICLPFYFGAVLITYINCVINATAMIKSMAFHNYMTVYNDKVHILREMLNTDSITTIQLLANFQHNYTNLNRVSIWKKEELLNMPFSFKLSSVKMQEMMKLNLLNSLFDHDKQFKEYLVGVGHNVFHPPGKEFLKGRPNACS